MNIKNFYNKNNLLLLILFAILINNSLFAQPLASEKKKFVGNIIGNAYNIPSNFLKYWNQVTPENASKWGSVEYTPGNYNWVALDLIYNFAVNNNIPFKHHTLVWGQQMPSFVATMDSATLYQRIEAWIKACAERYPKTVMVDVVNEPLHAFTGTATNIVKALGGNGSTGWDWVVKAFELARKYMPSNTKLILNDYNIINSSSSTSSMITIVNILKGKKLIDGIGIQAHGFEIDGPATSTLKSNLDKLYSTGIPIYITEFDLSSADDQIQLQKYKTIFPVLYEHPGVVGVTLWGYLYGQTWRADANLLNDRNAERPALQWLRNYLLAPFRPNLIYPIATTNEVRNPIFKWNSSETANKYRLQVSNNRFFTTFEIDTLIADTIFQSKILDANTTYYWHVSSKNDKAEGEFTDVVSFQTGSTIVSIENQNLPTEFFLKQNYPNPFNPSTTIEFQIPTSSFVKLEILNSLGQKVITLINNFLQAGNHKIVFEAHSLSSGIYFYKLTTEKFQQTKKMQLLK